MTLTDSGDPDCPPVTEPAERKPELLDEERSREIELENHTPGYDLSMFREAQAAASAQIVSQWGGSWDTCHHQVKRDLLFLHIPMTELGYKYFWRVLIPCRFAGWLSHCMNFL